MRISDWSSDVCSSDLMSYRIGYDDLDAITSAAVDGAGLARLPNWLVFEHMRENRLVKVLDEALPFGSELHVVWPHTRYLPRKSRVVIAALIETIPPQLSRCMYGTGTANKTKTA